MSAMPDFQTLADMSGLGNDDLAGVMRLSPARAAVTFAEWRAGRKNPSPERLDLLRLFIALRAANQDLMLGHWPKG